MAAPTVSSSLDPPDGSNKISSADSAEPSHSNGSVHVRPNDSNLSPSPPPSSPSGTTSPDKGQAPLSTDQSPPSILNPGATSSPAPPSDSQPRVASKDAHPSSDADKTEDGSTTPTLTPKGTAQSRRNANGSSSSHPTHAPVNGAEKPTPSSQAKTPKSSFFSKLIHILVPCLSPSKSHSIEVDAPVPVSAESPQKLQSEKVEDPAPESTSKSVQHESSSAKDVQESVLDETGLTPVPHPVAVDLPPQDADVVVPPTPTKTLPIAETEGVTSGAVVPPGSTGTLHEKHSRSSTVPSNASTDGDESDFTDEDIDDIADEDPEELILLNGGAGIPIGPDGIPRPLLPPIAPQHMGRKCLILDLDETLVHSSFKSIQQADYVVPVEIEYHWHNVYVIKRPGVDNFLKKMGEIYEVVVFTASLSKYADPVLDKLDVHKVVAHRLFRESCYNHRGNYVKDLSQLGRPITDTIILDNSPASYIFHPNNAVPVSSWFNDPHDTELTDLVPFLADLSAVDDVRGVLDGAR